MQVVDVNAVFDRFVADFAGLSIGESAFHSATREPHREAVVVVIAARLWTAFNVSGAEKRWGRWFGDCSTLVETSFGHEILCSRPFAGVKCYS